MNKYLAQSRRSQRMRKRRRMCDDKVRYPSAEAARKTGNDIYRCKHCRQWHTTGLATRLAATLSKRFGRR